MNTTPAEKNKSFTEIIMASSAVIISLSALIVSIFQVNIMQEQMHLSVTPRLDISYSNVGPDNSREISISLINSGIGPAEIMAMEITLDNRPMNTWGNLLSEIKDELNYYPTFSSAKTNNRMLSPEKIFRIFSVTDSVWADKINLYRKRIKIKIYYRSLFEDWQVVTRESLAVDAAIVHEKVDGMVIQEANVFLR